jgi:hypothetical protein
MFPPTTKQRKLEVALAELTSANDGVPPSLAELAAKLGVTYGAAWQMSNRLCARGRARKQSRMPRTLELIGKEGHRHEHARFKQAVANALRNRSLKLKRRAGKE